MVNNTQLLHELGRVVPSIISKSSRQSTQCLSKCFNSKCLLSFSGRDQLVHSFCHQHFGAAAAQSYTSFFACLRKNSQGVVQGTFRLIKYMHACSAQNNRAGRATLYAGKANKLFLANHNLLNTFGLSESDELGVVKGGYKLPTCYCGKALYTVEIGVLNSHNASISKKLLRVVVDQLTVNEHVNTMGFDLVDLCLHFALFFFLDFGNLVHRVNLDT
mmetsp:Transcript_1245/g.1980  ORF Transcript_1245/g.1980 Transcript_1245/m.1980 type:complete len:217 (-) Transcript_1245:885-1535(-)